jgi:ornithine cyclodeaminase
LVLTGPEVESLLDLDELRQAVARAMIDVSMRRASMPARIAATVPDQGLLAAMPAYLPTDRGLASKLVSLFPGNAGTKLPTHQAVVIVFDPDTGEPTALLDGTSITTARTAAGSALSADVLARPDAHVLAILGTGVQARAHAEAVVRVRHITAVRIAGRNAGHAAALAAELQAKFGIPTTATTYERACAGADLVCATTHSDQPVVRREFLAPGIHVTSVGYNTAGRELDSATVAAALVVVESRDVVLAPPPAGSNDLLIPIEEGVIGPEHIHGEVGEVLSGARPGRTSPDQLTLYKSVGIAAQDVAAANLVLTAAKARGVGRQIEV